MEQKYTSFAAIPQFTRPGGYEVDYPLDRLVQAIKQFEQEEGLQLNPDFQRGHVWTEQQQIAYVEYLLRGGRSGRHLYFNYPSWRTPVPKGAYDEFVCVDGLQRLTAIRRFIENEIPVFGSYYREYTDSLHLTMMTLRVNINDLDSKEKVLRWYLEMNSGGTPHSDAEIQRVRQMLCEEQAAGERG